MDLSQLSDEQLNQLAQQKSQPDLSSLSDEQLEQLAQDHQDNANPKISRSEAAFTTLTNPLGFGDEIKGGIAAGTAKLFGGEATKDVPISELYTEARDAERTKQNQAREEYPIQSIATGLVSDVGATGKFLKGANTVKNLAKQGGAIAGLTAVGENEDTKEMPEDVIYGTALGLMGGVIVGKAAQGIKESYGVIANLISKNKDPEKQAINILSKYINPEDAKVVANKLISAEQKQRQILLPDISSDEVQGLTRLLGKTEGSKNIIADVFSKRTVGSNRRVANAINNKVSSEAYFGSLDEVSKARKALADPLYKKAYEEGNKKIQKLMKPKVTEKSIYISDGLGGVKKEITREEIPAKPLFDNPNIQKYISKAKNDPLFVDSRISNNDFAVLDGAKKMIDDDINAAMKDNKKEKARALLGIKNQIVNTLEEVSPTYKQARQVFADESSLMTAQQEGLDFNKYRPEELKRFMGSLSSGEEDAFKIGVRENLMRSVDKTPDGLSSARKIFARPENRNQLKIIFDNPKEYSDFARRMNDEMRIFNTKQRILGGSRTDINLADEGQIINKVAGGLLAPKTSLVKNTIDAVASSIQKKYRGLDEKNAKALAGIITNRTKSIDALTKIAERADFDQKKIIQKTIRDIAPVIISGYVGGNTPSFLKEETEE